ncbi:MAG: YlxR family protein [Clostridiaceae bacterium]|nr:YlxR family protein [Clostridiaceae bacterium]
MPKKIPIRQCVACREHREKPLLARVVRTPDGRVVYDARGKVSGRGAYICRNIACLEKAVRTRALSRALETEIDESLLAELRLQMEEAARDG